ncbi:LysR family transcriptional regulator [Maritalea mobilis]|uniref:LysR family transcriptional regulator n=1 Tax=Maritalea mobilis TaxID=483324 RepID=UPI001C94A889|nr:LysR family transcriptional regulator [Maritalea mobilis]MBY6201434.1 LysR family transcriptional regulator [Maritalea mobilis]
MLKIETLRGFAAVARCGNLSDAAATLGRTPSAVSMMLKQLETHLGEPLFETDRKNRLTALGRFVLDHAERELHQFDTTVRAIEGYAKAVYGSVRIATVPSIAGTIMPQVMARHFGRFDEVDIELRDIDSNSILHEVLRNRVDIGIATIGQNRAGLHSQLLMTDAFGVVCAPSHPLAKEDGPIEWETLMTERIIANSLSESIDAIPSRDLHEASRLKAHNVASILGMVRANIGISLLPKMTILAFGSDALVFRPLADQTARRELHILRRADATLSPAARMLEERIRDTVASIMQDM